MRTKVNVTPILLLFMFLALPVTASETLTVAADSTLAGHEGFIVHITSTFEGFSSLFLFEENDKLRLFAGRDGGSTEWDILSSAQYVVPTTAMTVGQSWDFIDTDEGEARVARVVGQEQRTTSAGTFTCLRVKIERVSAPGVADETIWFAWGVGFVRDQGYVDGYLDWRDELQSYSISSGTGYMPMGVGNTWSYVERPVASEAESWGGLKRLYR